MKKLLPILLFACSNDAVRARTDGVGTQAVVSIDPRRSVVVTDQVILTNFTLERVLTQLAAATPGLAPLDLFHQWWDTENPGPGLGLGPHCDDVIDSATGDPLFNGYPSQCRPNEGLQAKLDPFTDADTSQAAYMPLGLFNRFDLAPQDGSHCGEYRIEFARRSGVGNSSERALVIFEAALPNPHPEQGLEACLPVVQFWADLSQQSSAAARAAALEQFYFKGIPGFEPVVSPTHYGDNAASFGQIRTNQFMNTDTWQLREFKLRTSVGYDGVQRTQIVPTTVKTNPFFSLFNAQKTLPATADFQQFLTDSVLSLAVDDVNAFNYAPADEFNTGISNMSGQGPVNDYLTPFQGPATGWRVQIEQILIDNQLPLSADNIVARAQALSCAGCHELSVGQNLGGTVNFPFSNGFVQVTEQFPDTGPDGPRAFVSQAISGVFMPHRLEVMTHFLSGQRQFVARPSSAIGGRSVH